MPDHRIGYSMLRSFAAQPIVKLHAPLFVILLHRTSDCKNDDVF